MYIFVRQKINKVTKKSKKRGLIRPSRHFSENYKIKKNAYQPKEGFVRN